MTIGVDVDGVLADFIGSVCRSMDIDESLVVSDVRNHIHKDRIPLYEMTVTSPGFIAGIGTLPGADDLVDAMLSYGDYVVVTSPIDVPGGVSEWIKFRTEWLTKIGLDQNKVVFMRPEQKTHMKLDMLIEDNEWTTENWCRRQGSRSALLVKRPWNSGRLSVEQCAKAVRCQRALRDGLLG